MFSPKSHSVINIIAVVSIIAIAVPTAATIILLAMFGGLDKTIREIYATADADIEITSTQGQTFAQADIDYDAIANIEGVCNYTSYIEQSVIIATQSNRTAVTLRGIDSNYGKVLTTEKHIIDGSFESIQQGDVIAGVTIASTIGVYGIGAEVELYALNRKQMSTLLPTSGLSRMKSHLGGVSMANADLDAKLVLVDIAKAQELLNHDGKITHIAIDLTEGADIEHVRHEIEGIVGEGFEVLTREEKNASLNDIMELEKFIILLIGCFIALIAAFSIVGSVVMLLTEKRRDITIIKAMGGNDTLIRRIFVGEGLLLTICGTLIGTILGVGFALLQEHFGLIKLEGNMVVENYPIDINIYDIILVALIMISIGYIISQLTVRTTLRRYKK
jgi:ABC-type lipoprotein release transport system permease subunit